MASGTALMIVMIVALFRITNRHVDDGLVLWPGRFLAVCLLVVVYFLFVENAYRAYVVELRHAALYYLFGGFHSVLFWGGLVIMGCFVPMLILFNRKTGRSIKWVVFASAVVVFGVLCERYVIVIPGLTHPPDLFPGMELIGSAVEEGIASYSISLVEVLQALGGLGVIGFLFVWGLKTFRLLPTEARLHGQPAD
jgi:molybdopterin-containing oxidoreductase family membrane subunit